MTRRRRGRTRAIGVGLPLKSATVPNNIGYSTLLWTCSKPVGTCLC